MSQWDYQTQLCVIVISFFYINTKFICVLTVHRSNNRLIILFAMGGRDDDVWTIRNRPD